jgi:Carboxypeptidase regulatory-like domain
MVRAAVWLGAPLVILLFLLSATAARAQVPPPPPPPPPPLQVAPPRDTSTKTGTASIRGRVVAVGTNAPIARAQVHVSSPDNSQGKSAETDANGRYEIAALPAGKYALSAFKTNYVRTSYGQTRPNGAGQPIDVADGQAIANVNVALPRAGVIAGKILDEFGEPVVDVQVMVTRSQYVNGERRMMPAGGRGAMPNDLGEYRLFGIAPGQYYLSATLRNFMGGEADDRSGYAPTYYPGTGSVAEAQRITIAAAQQITGINLTLLPVRTTHISGTAFGSDGKPLTGAMVMTIDRGGFGMSGRPPSQVKPDGSFLVTGMTPGNYTLRIMMPGLDEVASAPITVAGADIDRVQLVAAKSSVIRGRILIDRGATPPRPSAIRLFATAVEPMVGGAEVKINEDFTFEVKMPPGRVTLRAAGASPDDWRLHGVHQNGLDVADSGIDVPTNTTVTDVTVEMTKQVTEASGRVLDASGRPIRDAWVLMFAQDPVRWGSQSRYVGTSRPDVNDGYKIRVPAGDYFLVAVAEVEPGEWNDPDFLSPLRDRAVRVTLADGERKTIDLTLAETK